jgi:hypothetical protein
VLPIVPFQAGGTRSPTNLRMLHPTCHRRLRTATGSLSGRAALVHRLPSSGASSMLEPDTGPTRTSGS